MQMAWCADYQPEKSARPYRSKTGKCCVILPTMIATLRIRNRRDKYQDIYPFDFECEAWQSLWEELRSIFQFWIDKGVRIFRVDNPHTKPFAFWEWVIAEIRRRNPEVIFLAEAFTRPKVMYRL